MSQAERHDSRKAAQDTGAYPTRRLKTGEPQLFVDDERIAVQRGVTRTLHPCTKLPAPVLETREDWEGSETDSRVYIYGSVQRDPASGQLRMWYNRMSRVLMATSVDGVHWERPKLGLVDFRGSRDNNILPVAFHSPSIVKDEHSADSERHFKMFGCIRGEGYGAAYSADGLTWHMYPKNPVLPGGDTCTLAQDPVTGEFLAFHKRYHRHRGHHRRLVYLSSSRDMQTWSDPELVLAPDQIDDAQTQGAGGRWSEFYNVSVFPYGGQFLGLVTHFQFSGEPDRHGPGQSPHDGPIDVQLVHSRDGRKWQRLAERRPIIPNGPHPYDAGCILGVANQPVVVDDRMWVYYTAITTTHGGSLPEKKITIARAAWRRDGFISMSATAAGGLIQTTPFYADGRRLHVNADAGGGEITVEVVDAEQNVIPGYGIGDCMPLESDDVSQQVRWTSHHVLPSDGPIALRLHLQRAALYSYSLMNAAAPQGAENVAAPVR